MVSDLNQVLNKYLLCKLKGSMMEGGENGELFNKVCLQDEKVLLHNKYVVNMTEVYT